MILLLSNHQYIRQSRFDLPGVLLAWLVSVVFLICPITGFADDIPLAALQHQHSLVGLNDFALEGRMAVQYDGRGYSCQIHWHKTGDSQQISLISPLGNTIADINASADGVMLVSSDNKQYSAQDAEQLTEQILGWPLPVRLLHDWILGRPAPGPVIAQQWDSAGKLIKLNQSDWSVEYAEYKEVEKYSLPTKLTLRHPKIYLRFIIDDWQVML